jgi:hypothetical protein
LELGNREFVEDFSHSVSCRCYQLADVQ